MENTFDYKFNLSGNFSERIQQMTQASAAFGEAVRGASDKVGLSEAEMKAKGEALLKLYKRDGLSGSLTTFGEPSAGLLDHVAVKLDGVRMGVYQIRKNEIRFGSDGYRQKIELGRRVD